MGGFLGGRLLVEKLGVFGGRFGPLMGGRGLQFFLTFSSCMPLRCEFLECFWSKNSLSGGLFWYKPPKDPL